MHVVLYCAYTSLLGSILSCTHAMSESNDSVTGTDSLYCNIKITVEDTEIAGISDSNERATSFCTETNELHEENLQVPINPTLPNDTKKTDEMKKPRYSFKGSITSLASEVFTAQNITKAVKCRLVTTLIVTICIMVLLFLTPIVLYNINPPIAEKYITESTIFYNMEVDSCFVSANMFVYRCICMYYCMHQG